MPRIVRATRSWSGWVRSGHRPNGADVIREEEPVTRTKVGVQLHPQHCSIDDLRTAWREADAMGVDSIWTWDHFYPLYGEPDGAHFEGWSLLAAMACDTTNAHFGAMVTCNSYRNPELLADMARTVDHLSGGRLILGVGAGWFERDYDEFGYPFGTAIERLRALEAALPRIESRLAKLNPPPVQEPLPILIGGGGEKVTLRIVAEHADLWNGFGPPENYAHKNEVLTAWCERAGRDPAEIERTVLIERGEVNRVDAYLEAGAQHLIVMLGTDGGRPFDLSPVRQLLDTRG
jgi:probable F420-dependent oxidoreductase